MVETSTAPRGIHHMRACYIAQVWLRREASPNPKPAERDARKRRTGQAESVTPPQAKKAEWRDAIRSKGNDSESCGR